MEEEKELEELAKICDLHHIGCNLHRECYSECGICAVKAILEAGYHKIRNGDIYWTKEELSASDWASKYYKE